MLRLALGVPSSLSDSLLEVRETYSDNMFL